VRQVRTIICEREPGKIGWGMHDLDFLARLEDHLAARIATLDVKAHPSSDGPRRLTRQWAIEFIAMEAAKHPQFQNLAALLRTVNEGRVG
jgi:hypothetical protein